MAKANPLTIAETAYIDSYYSDTPVKAMADHMRRTYATVAAYMNKKGYKPFRTQHTNSKNQAHPFRMKNRRLEQVVISRRIENRKHNPK